MTNAVLLGSAGWMPNDARETACVLLRHGHRALILDAGTGIRRLVTSPDLLAGVTRVDVLLSHFHLDHVIGLSYLPGLGPKVESVVWGPGSWLYGEATDSILARLVGAPFFAENLDKVVSRVEEISRPEIQLGPFNVTSRAQELHTHPSVGFRVGDDFVYCTDTGFDPGAVAFAAGARHLLHEAFWCSGSIDTTHSTAGEAATIARRAGVPQLTLVHIDPRLRDVSGIVAEAQAIFPATTAGRDRLILDP